MDKKKIEEAVKLFLEGIGEDPSREGLVETPDRVARMCEEIFGGLSQDASEHMKKQFSVEQRNIIECTKDGKKEISVYNSDIVLEKDITFYSTCEHHLLPFYGKAHIAYIPNDKIVGLSKLARTVEVFARRPQIQEKLTNQIADTINDNISPRGVLVIVEAEHMCMTMRGIKKPGSKTVTIARRGDFETDNALVQNVFSMLK